MSKKTRVKRPSVEVGQKFETSHGVCEVVEYVGWESITVKFDDGYTKAVQVSQLKSGNIRNPYFPKVAGIGYLGEGVHMASDENGSTRAYKIWQSMLVRCYDKKQQVAQPSYEGVVVCNEWHNFQNFAEWYYNNYIVGWHLDKDLLSDSYKVYSKSTCCFLPPELNYFLTKRDKMRGNLPIGVCMHKKSFAALYWDSTGKKRSKHFSTASEAFTFYKNSKEQRAKVLANKYKNELNSRVYNALINYEVNIND